MHGRKRDQQRANGDRRDQECGITTGHEQILNHGRGGDRLVNGDKTTMVNAPLTGVARTVVSSAPNPKFAQPCRESVCELRVQKGH
jgi:hypothetical protein